MVAVDLKNGLPKPVQRAMTSQDDNHKTWALGARISRAPLTDIGKK